MTSDINPANGAASHVFQVDHAPGEPVEVAMFGPHLLTSGNAETCCGGTVLVHSFDGEAVDRIARIDAPPHAQGTNFGSTIVAIADGFLIGGPGVDQGGQRRIASGNAGLFHDVGRRASLQRKP